MATLAEIKERFDSADEMTERLRRNPDFSRLAVSTVWRWLRLEREGGSPALPASARRAIDLLDSAVGALRVAWYPAPLYLPLFLSDSNGKSGSSPLKKAGVEISWNATATSGRSAFKMLEDDKADIAFGYRHLFKPLVAGTKTRNVDLLCSFCRYSLEGVQVKAGSDPDTDLLREASFAYPIPSGIRDFLVSALPLASHEFEEFSNAEEAVALLEQGPKTKGRFLIAVCWRPLLDEIKMLLKERQKTFHPTPVDLLPPIDIALFVNRRTPSPKAVLDFVRCLHDQVETLFDRVATIKRNNPDLAADLLRKTGLGQQGSAGSLSLDWILEHHRFSMDRVNLPVLLELSDRAVITERRSQ